MPRYHCPSNRVEGVAKEDGTVAPGHRGGLLNPVVDQRLEPLVLAVDVVDAELDDDGVVVGGARGVLPEQLGGLGVRDPDGNLVNLFTPVTEEAIKKFNG